MDSTRGRLLTRAATMAHTREPVTRLHTQELTRETTGMLGTLEATQRLRTPEPILPRIRAQEQPGIHSHHRLDSQANHNLEGMDSNNQVRNLQFRMVSNNHKVTVNNNNMDQALAEATHHHHNMVAMVDHNNLAVEEDSKDNHNQCSAIQPSQLSSTTRTKMQKHSGRL